MNNTVKCPKCGFVVDVAAGMEMELKKELEAMYKQDLAAEASRIKNEVDKETKVLVQQAYAQGEREANKALKEFDRKARMAEDELKEVKDALHKAHEGELLLIRAKQKLEDDKAGLELEVARKLDEERANIKLKAAQAADEEHRLKDMEKDKKLSDMLEQIESLKRKAEQSSQQAQGEILELDLEAKMKAAYPFDIIEPVGKGVSGADIIQNVFNNNQDNACGKIVWEIKRTKSFVKSWLAKVRQDMREAKASLCVIVTETMPDGITDCACLDGVWVCSIQLRSTVADLLRLSLISANKALEIKRGRESKATEVYDYLTGEEFRNRVTAVIEAYGTMREELEKEKAAITKTWERRSKQLERVQLQLAGMHGDLSGIVGNELPGVKVLELEG